jgi:hypothetical protein
MKYLGKIWFGLFVTLQIGLLYGMDKTIEIKPSDNHASIRRHVALFNIMGAGLQTTFGVAMVHPRTK